MVYKFRTGFQLAGDPQVVGESLDKIRQKKGGAFGPADVVDDARRPTSVLHKYFEWNDKKAAHQYRLQQADYIVRAVVVCPDDNGPSFEPVRAFVSVSQASDDDEQKKTPVFMHIHDIMRDSVLRQQLLAKARAELQAWRIKYANLVEFAKLFRIIDKTISNAGQRSESA